MEGGQRDVKERDQNSSIVTEDERMWREENDRKQREVSERITKLWAVNERMKRTERIRDRYRIKPQK